MNIKKILMITCGIIIALGVLVLDIAILNNSLNFSKPTKMAKPSNWNIFDNQMNDLYPMYDNKHNKVLFINKKGISVFEIDKSEYDLIGEYNEGLICVGKTIKKIDSDMDGYTIALLSVLNNKGNRISTSKREYRIPLDFENGSELMPFYNGGIAAVNLLNNEEIYIDKNFNIVENGQLPPKRDSNQIFFEGIETFYKYPEKESFDDSNLLGYMDEQGKIIMEAQFEIPPGGYGYWNPNFFNGIALVSKNGKYGYINKKGEYLIEPSLIYAEPFVKSSSVFFDYGPFITDLAYVVTSEKEGYIDKKGNWVWSKSNKKDAPAAKSIKTNSTTNNVSIFVLCIIGVFGLIFALLFKKTKENIDSVSETDENLNSTSNSYIYKEKIKTSSIVQTDSHKEEPCSYSRNSNQICQEKPSLKTSSLLNKIVEERSAKNTFDKKKLKIILFISIIVILFAISAVATIKGL